MAPPHDKIGVTSVPKLQATLKNCYFPSICQFDAIIIDQDEPFLVKGADSFFEDL